MYPKEPKWLDVPLEILYELIENYDNEPNCATSALFELSEREDEKTLTYCSWVLEEKNTDKWLKEAAKEIINEKKL